jgi:hypothetical protein
MKSAVLHFSNNNVVENKERELWIIENLCNPKIPY